MQKTSAPAEVLKSLIMKAKGFRLIWAENVIFYVLKAFIYWSPVPAHIIIKVNAIKNAEGLPAAAVAHSEKRSKKSLFCSLSIFIDFYFDDKKRNTMLNFYGSYSEREHYKRFPLCSTRTLNI